MNIAVWHNLPSGGGKRALYEHVRGLLRRGHTVQSWCPPTADQTYLPLGDLAPERIVPFAWTEREIDGRVARLITPYRNLTTKIRAMDRHCRACAAEISAGRFDVLLAGSCSLLRVPSIARHLALPTVLYLQEPYRWLYEALPELPWLAKRGVGGWTPKAIYKRLEDLIGLQALRIQAREEVDSAKAFDHILVNSMYSRESVLRAYGVDATVCYLGIDTAKFQYAQQPREPFVISVGALVREKNPRFLIEAVARLAEPRPTLVWVANMTARACLTETTQAAATLGVTFDLRVGISDIELVDLLNRATAMLYAPRLEPFGLAPLEANSCGLPVIAVAEGGVRETVLDGVNGWLVPDENAMAIVLERLLKNPEEARRLGENGIALVNERWSMEVAIDRLEKSLFKAVAGQSRRSR